MKRSPRWIATLVAFSLASVVNPGYFSGCVVSDGGGDHKFYFGEAEMLDLLDAANATGPFEVQQANETYRLELTLSQAEGEDDEDSGSAQLEAALYSRAFACGNRTFMQSASACIPTTSMPLHATLSVYRQDADGDTEVLHEEELEGFLSVFGPQLRGGLITLAGGPDEALTQITLSSNDAKTFSLTQFAGHTSDMVF